MKIFKIILPVFVTLSSCGQTTSTNKEKNTLKPTDREALVVYQNMTGEICNCTLNTMKNSKPSTSLDSCYKVVLGKYADALKTLGYDTASSIGKNKLLNEIKLYQCQELYSLLNKEWLDEEEKKLDEESKKLLFKGEFISQKKLITGEYEIILKDSKTKEQKVFKARNRFDENSVKNYLPGYELTIEYEIIKNPKTKIEEFYIKENGTVIGVGAVPVTN